MLRKIPIWDGIRAEVTTSPPSHVLRGYDVGMSYGFYNLTEWAINNGPVWDLDKEHMNHERAQSMHHYTHVMLDIETLDEHLKSEHPEWSEEQLLRELHRIVTIYYKRFKKYLPNTKIAQYNQHSHLNIDGEVYSDFIVISQYRRVNEQTPEEFLDILAARFDKIDQSYSQEIILNTGPRDYTTQEIMDEDEFEYILRESIKRFPIHGANIWDAQGGGLAWPSEPLQPIFRAINNITRDMNYPSGTPPYRGSQEPREAVELPGVIEHWTAMDGVIEDKAQVSVEGQINSYVFSSEGAGRPEVERDEHNQPFFRISGNSGFTCPEFSARKSPIYMFATFYKTNPHHNGCLIDGFRGAEDVFGYSVEARKDYQVSMWNGGPARLINDGWVPSDWQVIAVRIDDRGHYCFWDNEFNKTVSYKRSGSRTLEGLTWGIRHRLNTALGGGLGELTIGVGHLSDAHTIGHMKWLKEFRKVGQSSTTTSIPTTTAEPSDEPHQG